MTREIHLSLVSCFDDAAKDNSDLHWAIDKKMWRPIMVIFAESFDGALEATDKNDGYFVRMVQYTVDRKSQGEPYCVGLPQTAVGYVELKTGLNPLSST